MKFSGYGHKEQLTRLIDAQIDCFTLLKLGVAEVCALGVLFVRYWNLNENMIAVYLLQRKMPDLTPWRQNDRIYKYKMTLSNANIFRVTGPLWGEFTGHQWIPLTYASDAELWCFLWSASVQTDAGVLRRHRSHYDVITMKWISRISRRNVKVVHGSSTHWSKNNISTSPSVWRGRHLIILPSHY